MDSHNSFICPICGNTDIHSIGTPNGILYCRRCISFRGGEVEYKPSYPKKAPIHLVYELSPEQKELSDKLVENYKKKKMIHQTNNGSHLRITTYIKPK